VAPVAGQRTLLVRAALFAAAALVCAWFVLGAVQVHALSEANALLPRQAAIAPPLASRISHLLDRAGTLNPDRTIDILRAEVMIGTGNRPAGERDVLAVVRAEPQNIDAWIVLQIAAVPRDPATEQLSVEKQRELAPPVPAAP
jgi:hypothetical protein